MVWWRMSGNDAAIPITVSLSLMLCSINSSQPRVILSSAFSTGLRRAVSPPAIKLMTNVGGIPKVMYFRSVKQFPGVRLFRHPYRIVCPPRFMCARHDLAYQFPLFGGNGLLCGKATFWSSVLMSSWYFPDRLFLNRCRAKVALDILINIKLDLVYYIETK